MTNTGQTGQPISNDENLRFSFVEMLFALAVAEIAIQFATLARLTEISFDYFPAVAHLALATSLIATSWVGWKRSKAKGNSDSLSIFDISFVVLAIDIVLVIFYFVIVRGVDFQVNADQSIKPTPSFISEAQWMTYVFAAFVVWDLVARFAADGLASLSIGDNWWRFSCSVVGFFLCLILWKYAPTATDAVTVVLLDGALISIIFLYRAAKERSIGGVLLFASLLIIALVTVV